MNDKPTSDERRMYHDAAALDSVLRSLGCDPERAARVAAKVAVAIGSGPIGERVAAMGRLRRWAESRAERGDCS